MVKQRLRREVGRLCYIRHLLAGKSAPAGSVLMYHSVGPTIECGSLQPHRFEEQLAYLAEHRVVISLRELADSRRAGRPLPANSVVITFDDGFEDNYTHAFPLLMRYGLKATIFLTTRFVDGAVDITARWPAYRGLPPLNWTQVREMRAAGIQFGAHTVTHSPLTGLSQEDAWREIHHSRQHLQHRLKEPVAFFAYPRGQIRDISRRLMRLVAHAGFEAACTSIWGTDNRHTHLFALLRLRIDAFDTARDFEAKLRGDWDFVALYQRLKGLSFIGRGIGA
jgi:peptidoglycan/xylan/chitin deacetylase (PgdA/CDA1 family)